MEKCSHFWLGLGIGSVIGALAYGFSRTEKAKQLKEKVYKAYHKIEDEAGTMMRTAKDKAVDAGNKLVEKGVETAEKVSSKAENMQQKWNNYAADAKK